jgi:hypothetical protein
VEFINPVRPSVRLYPIFSPSFNLRSSTILDSKRRLSIYEEYGWVFRSKAQELWNSAQIRTLLIVADGQLGLTGGAQSIFFPNPLKTSTTFGSPAALEICSNYSIRRWSFLFINICSWKILLNCWFLQYFDKK